MSMRSSLALGGVFTCLVALSGCVGGGYAFSDTYQGVITEDPTPVAARERQDDREEPRMKRERYVRHHRSIGYVYDSRG